MSDFPIRILYCGSSVFIAGVISCSIALADTSIDSTVVAFELRQELTDAASNTAGERLDLSLAHFDGTLASSLTARIPLDAQPTDVDIASGHLVWRPEQFPLEASAFFGENRILAPQGQIRLVDLTSEWANMQGMRVFYSTATGANNSDGQHQAGDWFPTRLAVDLATAPDQDRSIACLWIERNWKSSHQRLTGVRVTPNAAGKTPADSSRAAAAAVWYSDWRIGSNSRLPLQLSTELGISGRQGWAAALEVRDLGFRVDFANTLLICIPSARWTAPAWRSPSADMRSGRRELELLLHATNHFLRTRLLFSRAYRWHTSMNPSFRLEAEISRELTPRIDLRIRARSIRDTERLLTHAGKPPFRETFATPTSQRDLLVEMQTAATASAWSRTQFFRSWLDHTSVVGMEWGTRVTPTFSALVRILAGAHDDEARAATAHTIILQAFPQPLLSIELQFGSPAIGSRGAMAEDAALFDPDLERNGVSLVLKGAFH